MDGITATDWRTASCGRLADCFRRQVDTSGWDRSRRALSLMSNLARVVVALRDDAGISPDCYLVDQLATAQGVLAVRFGRPIVWALCRSASVTSVIPASYLGEALPGYARIALDAYLSFIPAFRVRAGFEQPEMFFREHQHVLTYVKPFSGGWRDVAEQRAVDRAL